MSCSSSSTSTSTSSQLKWDAVYALRERIVQFVARLEKRTRLYPSPFHRQLVGGDDAIQQLAILHSEAVSKVANEYILGVFNQGDTLSTSSPTYLCNYPGWLLTQHEYTELNNADNENMCALYGVDISLSNFVNKNWNDKWDPAWKEVAWVVLGDPVAIGSNINTLSGIENKTYNCELRINYSSEMKILTKDGRYSLVADTVTVHRKATAILNSAELFVAYDNVIREKKEVLEERLS